MKPIIEIKNLSKEYTLFHKLPYYTLRDTLTNVVKKPLDVLRGKAGSHEREKFLALKDINFSIQQGERVGIIGRNGAGKSTLLKILSQITPPTTGEICLRGRVASLLEVGTGFHPELTGRENVYLNGAILGMKQKEIAKKFDEIVAFAEIDKFLDTPVKRYSSGMYVRLAFAVAAHLEPEILIVDEVLAVGDAQFQKKCLGKMKDVASKGRTVIFVSHNMGAIKQLCSRAVLLEKGTSKIIGDTHEVIQSYLSEQDPQIGAVTFLDGANPLSKASISFIKIIPKNGDESCKTIPFMSSFVIEIGVQAKENIEAVIGIGITNQLGEIITTIHTQELGKSYATPQDELTHLSQGTNIFRLHFDKNFFRPGRYSIDCAIINRKMFQTLDEKPQCLFIDIDDSNDVDRFDERQNGIIIFRDLRWEKV